jgi:peptidyl-tRNA hydrolase
MSRFFVLRSAQVFGYGSRYFPNSRMSIGFWCVDQVLQGMRGVKWRMREDLMCEVAEVGDSAFVKPIAHTADHNTAALRRVKRFLGLPGDRVTVVHHDTLMPVGEMTNAVGVPQQTAGVEIHEAGVSIEDDGILKMAAKAFPEEQFGRLVIGVASVSDASLMNPLVTCLAGDQPPPQRAQRIWMSRPLTPEEQQIIREKVFDRLAREMTGASRRGSIYDPTHRL